MPGGDSTTTAVKEVGQALVRALTDIRDLRENLEPGSQEARALDAVLHQAESSLRAPAVAVAQALRKDAQVENVFRRRGVTGMDQRDRYAAHNLAGSSGRSTLVMAQRPESVVVQKKLREKYGIPQPSRTRGSRSVGVARSGKLTAAGVTAPSIVPKDVTLDPHATLDPESSLYATEAAKGVLNMKLRGVIDQKDMTDLMQGDGGLMSTGGLTLYDHSHKHVKQEMMTMAKEAARTLRKPTPKTAGKTAPRQREAPHAVAAELSKVSLSLHGEPSEDAPGAPAEEAGDRDSEARDYEQLLDDLSLHQIMVRNGEVVRDTPEYESFERAVVAKNNTVKGFIVAVEAFCAARRFKLAIADGKALLHIAQASDIFEVPIGEDDIEFCLEAVVGSDGSPSEEEGGPGSSGRSSRSSNAPSRGAAARPQSQGSHAMYMWRKGRLTLTSAATRIQSAWRGFKQRRAFRELQLKTTAVIPIQMAWRRRLKRQETLEIFKQRRLAREAAVAELQAKFKAEWGRMDKSRHVVIHVPSFSADVDQRLRSSHLAVKQNGQMARLCCVSNLNVDAVYVAPYPIGEDLEGYYSKLLEVGGVKKPSKRYRIIYPENYKHLPAQLSLTNALLCSPKAMKRIQMLIKGRAAYIVPGTVGPEEVDLAAALNIPLLSPLPEVSRSLSSKSGARQLFKAADVKSAPGVAVPPGLAEADFRVALAEALAENPFVEKWLLKLDHESGGRGHATFKVGGIASAKKVLDGAEGKPKAEVVADLADALGAELGKAVEVACPELFPSFPAYLAELLKQGGVVEGMPVWVTGSPSVNLLIKPNGAVAVLSTHEQIFAPNFCFIGAAFPQSSVPHEIVHDAALAIGQRCFEEGVIGHVGVDFVALRDAGQLRMWAVDLNLRMTPTQAAFALFRFVTGEGTFDARSGNYLVPQGGSDEDRPPSSSWAPRTPSRGGGGWSASMFETNMLGMAARRRFYVINHFLAHPGMKPLQYASFFKKCRLEGVFFDMEAKVGTAFNLLDSFTSGVMGVVSVSHNPVHAFLELAQALDFLAKLVGTNNAMQLQQDPDAETLRRAHSTIKFISERLRPPPG